MFFEAPPVLPTPAPLIAQAPEESFDPDYEYIKNQVKIFDDNNKPLDANEIPENWFEGAGPEDIHGYEVMKQIPGFDGWYEKAGERKYFQVWSKSNDDLQEWSFPKKGAAATFDGLQADIYGSKNDDQLFLAEPFRDNPGLLYVKAWLKAGNDLVLCEDRRMCIIWLGSGNDFMMALNSRHGVYRGEKGDNTFVVVGGGYHELHGGSGKDRFLIGDAGEKKQQVVVVMDKKNDLVCYESRYYHGFGKWKFDDVSDNEKERLGLSKDKDYLVVRSKNKYNQQIKLIVDNFRSNQNYLPKNRKSLKDDIDMLNNSIYVNDEANAYLDGLFTKCGNVEYTGSWTP